MAAKKGADNLVNLEIPVSQDEHKRFFNYLDQGKFASPRLAFVHLLRLGEGVDTTGDAEGENPEAVKTNGLSDKEEPKDEEAKQVKTKAPRKGKKMAEEAAVSDVEMKSGEEVAPAAGESAEEKEAKEDDKKPKGRKGKKAAAKDDEEHHGDGAEQEEHKNGGHHEEGSGDDADVPKQGKKRAPAKKPAARKGKQDAAEPDDKKDATFDMDEHAGAVAESKPEPVKKPARGKKAAAVAEEPEKHENGGEDAGDLEKGKPSKAAKADADGAPEAKKRRGKAKADDEDYQEPAAAATATKGRGMKKMTSASSVVDAVHDDEPQDEPAANGDGKKTAKRKPAASKAAIAEEPDSTAAAKPKRGRAAKKNTNYAEHEDECC